MDRLVSLTSQLDGLVVMLSAAHREVFDTIRCHEDSWFPASQDPQLPDTLDAFVTTIANAAFLIGYAYLKAFLCDVARDIYLRRPAMLSPEKQLTFREVLDSDSKDAIVQLMVQKEVRAVMSGSIIDVSEYFARKFQIRWSKTTDAAMLSRTRNCLMHNGGIVDDELAAVSDRVVGSPIRLTPDEVHGFGIIARELAREVLSQAWERHLNVEDSRITGAST